MLVVKFPCENQMLVNVIHVFHIFWRCLDEPTIEENKVWLYVFFSFWNTEVCGSLQNLLWFKSILKGARWFDICSEFKKSSINETFLRWSVLYSFHQKLLVMTLQKSNKLYWFSSLVWFSFLALKILTFHLWIFFNFQTQCWLM